MRIAILADIHGNLPALEAVLADLHIQAPDAVYLAGDQICRVPWHNEVMAIIREQRWPGIFGNHEWVIGRLGTPDLPPLFLDRSLFSTLHWTKETLASESLADVRALPGELKIDVGTAPPILVTHGIPGDCFRGVFPYTPADKVAAALYTVDEHYVVLAHVHRPFDRCIGEGRGTRARWRVFNGGSVGLPYNGDVRAQYLILDGDRNGWTPTFRAVEFDRSGLRAAFERSGMLEAVGATGELHVLTAETGLPWSSDFAWWLHNRPGPPPATLEEAVAAYLASHGPGSWAFPADL